MKKKQKIRIIMLTLCISILAGCQAAPKTADINGSWLGQDIDQCYAAWGITPGENALKIGGDIEEHIFLTEPVEYLGNKFFVRLTYPVGDGEFYHNKLDSIVYFNDFYKASDDAVAEKASNLFAVLQQEYGALSQISINRKTIGSDESLLTNSSNADAKILQKDGIYQEMKSTKAGVQLSLICSWNLPSEYDKLNSDFVKAMEEYNNSKSTYSVCGSLEYVEGRYIFSITHTFSRIKDAA